MELYEANGTISKKLIEKANELRLPLGGTLELLPLCNMHCRMCYVYNTYDEMRRSGTLLNPEQWKKILQEARDNGVLYLLITGGEPLLYADFKEVYLSMLEMGFFVTLNTNGTLIDEEWADFFDKNRCRRINVTLYGTDDVTYEKVCRNPHGFTQVMRAATLLKEKNVPFGFTSSLIDENAGQIAELYQMANKFDVPYKPATYMFPAVRRNVCASEQVRMTPQKAARTLLSYYETSKSEAEMIEFVNSTLMNLFMPSRLGISAEKKGYPCRGGTSGFWVTWKGEMTSCAMLEDPHMSLLEHSFKESWNHIVEQTKKVPYCEKCLHCMKQNICHVCPAAVYTETGSFEERPDYLCEYTEELIKGLLGYLSVEERKPYEMALWNGGFKQII